MKKVEENVAISAIISSILYLSDNCACSTVFSASALLLGIHSQLTAAVCTSTATTVAGTSLLVFERRPATKSAVHRLPQLSQFPISHTQGQITITIEQLCVQQQGRHSLLGDHVIAVRVPCADHRGQLLG